jgi:hypothetical protein
VGRTRKPKAAHVVDWFYVTSSFTSGSPLKGDRDIRNGCSVPDLHYAPEDGGLSRYKAGVEGPVISCRLMPQGVEEVGPSSAGTAIVLERRQLKVCPAIVTAGVMERDQTCRARATREARSGSPQWTLLPARNHPAGRPGPYGNMVPGSATSSSVGWPERTYFSAARWPGSGFCTMLSLASRRTRDEGSGIDCDPSNAGACFRVRRLRRFPDRDLSGLMPSSGLCREKAEIIALEQQ